MLCCVVLCSVVLRCAVLCCVVLWCAVLCCVVLRCVVLCSVVGWLARIGWLLGWLALSLLLGQLTACPSSLVVAGEALTSWFPGRFLFETSKSAAFFVLLVDQPPRGCGFETPNHQFPGCLMEGSGLPLKAKLPFG